MIRDDNMKDKNLFITFSITFVLFSFIIFLMYLIYCYSYYDNRQIELYLDGYNSNSWDYVYDLGNRVNTGFVGSSNPKNTFLFNRNSLEFFKNFLSCTSTNMGDQDTFG